MSEIIECDFGSLTKAYRDGIKFFVDKDDYGRFVKGYSFAMNNYGYAQYSSTKDGLCHKLLHRVIMGNPEDMVIDHVNRDKLNNCRSNLRICTNQQNQMKRGKSKNNKTGVIGVSWHKSSEKWQATIRLNNKEIYLGCFDDLEDASQARKEAEIKYFGEFRNKDGE